ncbi:MAG: Uncharacterised protein [Alphaproteobacteria bacterium]|nr:MAG: Uncharacterised protein [Alphaproteobacteria bacterium]
MRLNFIGRADTAAQQNLRRIERAGRQDDFPLGTHGEAFTLFTETDTDRFFALKLHTVNRHIGFGMQVFAIERRMQIAARGTAPLGAAYRMLIARHTLLALAVKIFGERNTCLLTGFDKHIKQFIIFTIGFLHAERATRAVIFFIAITGKIFRPLEIGQHAFIRPALIAKLAPMVIIIGIAANINHRINGR